MEIKINNSLFSSDYITGIIGNYNFIIQDIQFNFIKSNVFIDNRKISIVEKKSLLNRIAILNRDIDSRDLVFTVYDYMKLNILNNYLNLRDYKKKINDSLKIVGFNESYLEKRLDTLSYTEKKYIILATSLLSNPDILIFDSFFEGLDLKVKKKVLNLVNQLSERYEKVIIFCSNDSEFIYRNSKNVVLVTKENEIYNNNTNSMYEDNIELLIKNEIYIPKTILFTNIVLKEKGIKLNYNKDIRDLIKDIYKKV